ncbi:hypothetical protein Ocin01_15605 [Orchesella cincta]|uniref:Uncharacterized protein n=1 Tax=Orchesella cincta TaxID=48709 RepID=A0A1D2MDM0_ORCCI|nr:hypothetical protein Ocin01_15605 [Orchesella cincta]
MKIVLVFVGLIALTYAGVGVVTPEVEREAERLWKKFCEGASEGGNDGDLAVYCKLSRDSYEESLQHQIEVTPPPQALNRWCSSVHQHTRISMMWWLLEEVLPVRRRLFTFCPSKNKNQVNLVDNTSNTVVTQKPTVYFLKKDHDHSKSQEEVGSQPASPPGGYLPPPKEPDNGYNYQPPRSGYN